jgi:PilX N-terminal
MRPHLRQRAGGEEGVALVLAIMAILLLSALGIALVMTTSTETIIASNFRNSEEGLYSADAAIERVMDDLLTVPDWNTVLAAGSPTRSAFVDGAPNGDRTLVDGSKINLDDVVALANCGHAGSCSPSELTTNSTGERPWGANNPVWQLYAYGPVNSLLPTSTINSSFYVTVLVADDPSENDDDPRHDGVTPCPTPPDGSACNAGSGVLSLRAEAFGPRGAHKVIEVTVARTDSSLLERGYTAQRGQDEQNRRARKASVQTPGKKLDSQALSLNSGGIS